MTAAVTRASQAVERALDERHREATDDVERILAAAVVVMQNVAPEPPRVSDIVTQAGTSKKTFYRYFTSKDDLLLAVLERGINIVVSYLEHQMAKTDDPAQQVSSWIRGALAQVSDPHLISMSRAVSDQLAGSGAVQDILGPLRDLLIKPLVALGSSEPDRDAEAVSVLTVAAMRRYIDTSTQPAAADTDHLVRFSLRALQVPPQVQR